MFSRRHGATEEPLKPTALNSSAPPRLREKTGVSAGKNRMFSRRRRGAENLRRNSCFRLPRLSMRDRGFTTQRHDFSHKAAKARRKPVLQSFLAPLRLRERTGFWAQENRMFSRRHGATEEPLKPTALNSSASPHLCERTGVSAGKNRMFSRSRGEPPIAVIAFAFPVSPCPRERTGFWVEGTPNVLTETRSHGGTAEAHSPEFLCASASPRENRGFGGKKPNVLAEAQSRGDAETRRNPMNAVLCRPRDSVSPRENPGCSLPGAPAGYRIFSWVCAK
jgi:hypothetical protein